LRYYALRGEFELARRVGCALDAVGEAGDASFAEELTGSVADRQEADYTLVNIDNPALPAVQMNAERLREATCDIVNQRKPFCFWLSADPFFLLIGLIGFLFDFPVRDRFVGTVAGC